MKKKKSLQSFFHLFVPIYDNIFIWVRGDNIFHVLSLFSTFDNTWLKKVHFMKTRHYIFHKKNKTPLVITHKNSKLGKAPDFLIQFVGSIITFLVFHYYHDCQWCNQTGFYAIHLMWVEQFSFFFIYFLFMRIKQVLLLARAW